MTRPHPIRYPARPPDQGQAIGLVLIGVALIASVAMAVAAVGSRMAERSKAQVAADAAALAGVAGGRPAAVRLAAQNGADLIAFTEVFRGAGSTVLVTVRVGGEQAIARASDGP